MIGLDPITVRWMSLRDVGYAMDGYDLAYKEAWRRSVLIANAFGAKITLDDVLRPPFVPTKEDISELNARADRAFANMETQS